MHTQLLECRAQMEKPQIGVILSTTRPQRFAVCVELHIAPLRSAVHLGLEPFLAVLQRGKSLADFDFLNQATVAMLVCS